MIHPLFLNGQEIINYQHRPINQSSYKKTKSIKLPFFDEFSNTTGAANSLLWEQSGVFINNTYAVNPPSAGVASFDACNEKAEVYENAETNNSFIADILTSLPIDLSEPNNNDVFLSFFFQAQGIANAPEKADSLILQFFDVINNKWNTVWFANGDTLKDFDYVILPVNQAEYLMDGFRFRFFNYVSFNAASTNSTITNADFWHLDYIYLNKLRSILDNNFQDIAFTDISNSFLKNYTSIPWIHFLNKDGLQTSEFSINLMNNDFSGRKIKERSLQYTEKISGSQSINYQFGAVNISAQTNEMYQFDVPFEFENNFQDSAIFEIKAHIQTDDYDYSDNNEIIYNQIFKDFYAYDDGTSEASYGIIGEGARNAMFACKFVSTQSGYLSAIDIYFNQPLLEQYSKPFYLTVWNSSNGQPGQIIYRKEGVRPIFDGDLNQFIRFSVDSITAIQDTFFIGWIQTTDYSLNVGYDLNRNSASQAFYNIAGKWQSSALSGSVMIRPAVTDKPSHLENIETQTKPIIYPHPVNQYFTLQGIENQTKLKIFDLNGRVVHQDVFNGQNISISHLQNGFYIILFYSDNQVIATQKLLIKH
jgi:hypothetical protein